MTHILYCPENALVCCVIFKIVPFYRLGVEFFYKNSFDF